MKISVQHQWKRTFNHLLLLASLLAVGFYIFINLQAVRERATELSPVFVALSFISICLHHFFSMIVWWSLTRKMAIELPFLHTGRAWFLSRLGRYVPGKIPFLLVRLIEYQKYPKRAVSAAFALEYIASLAAACLVVVIGLAFAPSVVPEAIRVIAGIGAMFFLILLYPPLFIGLLNKALTKFKKPKIELIPDYRSLLVCVLKYVLVATLAGVSFFLLLSASTDVSSHYFFLTTGIFYGAGLVGIASLFAPGGIGVSEGVMLLVLPLFIDEGSVILATLLIRLNRIFGDLLLAAIFVLLTKWSVARKQA